MTRPLCTGLFAYLLVLLTGALFGAMTAACVAVGMALLFVLRKGVKRGHRTLCLGLLTLALFSVAWHQHTAVAPSRALDGALAQVTGEVTSVSGEGAFQTAVVAVESVMVRGVTTHPRTNLSLVLTKGERVTAGDRLSLQTTLSFAPDAAGEPWLARHYRSTNRLLEARNGEGLTATSGSIPLGARLADKRAALGDRMGSPLVRALLFGDKSGLDRSRQELFQKTGMTHVLTFSGTHFAAIAAAVTMLLSLCGLRRRQIAAALLVMTFCLMTFMGFAPSVSRAGIMLLLSYGGLLLFRQADGLTSLAVAGFLLCSTRPYLIESTAFLLTFTSVLGILLLTKPLTELFTSLLPLSQSRLWRGVCSMASVTISASLSTAPILLLTFGELSTLAVPANLLTYPPMMALMLLGMVRLLLPLPFLDAAMAMLEHFSFGALEWLCSFGGGMVYADSVAVIVAYVGILGLVAVCFAHRRETSDRRLALLCAGAVMVCSLGAAPRAGQALTITMIDVGQGMSVLVRDGGVNILVDCGSDSAPDADARILRALRARGVSALDAVVITHPHSDHMSAFAVLAQELPIGELIVRDTIDSVENGVPLLLAALEQGVHVNPVEQICRIPMGKSVMTICAAHLKGEALLLNDQSLLVRVDKGESSLLLTGDMGGKAEKLLLQRADTVTLLREIDVLQVAHHGAEGSSTPAFLLEAMPAVALIPVGKNDYGHPSDKVLERLSSVNAHIFSTRENGTVELSTAGDGIFTVHTSKRGST